MDAENQEFRAQPQPGDEDAQTRRFTRRIDCAPAPRQPNPIQAPGAIGDPVAPGADA